MKLTAILVGTDSQRLEEHKLLIPEHALRTTDITAARDFLRNRAKLLGLRPVPGYTFTRGEIRVWAEPVEPKTTTPTVPTTH